MLIDIIVFVAFIAAVIFVGLWKSKGENTHGEQGATDYFLAGRGLSWWLIGFSLIAANISAEQFVGMSGQGAGLEGISCASWEWIAAITLVVVAFALLPYFLKVGITTIPEFLEVRYNHWARALMTLSMMLILIGVSLIGVIYAGSLTMHELLGDFGYSINLTTCCWIIGLLAAVYVAVGGLKACAWADLLQGSALILGGAIITYFALEALGVADVSTLTAAGETTKEVTNGMGAIEKFQALNESKLVMGRPASDKSMPWPILLLGIWIPNFYYWGLNQYITQRILGSASLAEGQKGLVFAGALKLLIPFIIVIPGIIAFNLYSTEMGGNAQKSFKTSAERVVNSTSETEKTYIVTKGDWTSHAELNAKIEANNAKIHAEIMPKIQAVQTETANTDIKAAALVVLKGNSFPSIKVIEQQAYKYDSALGLLISKLIPKNKGILGFVVAALLGAIISSLAAVLNAASTLFTMDIYHRYCKPKASQFELVTIGRICIGVFVVLGCIVAPKLVSFESIFTYIQKFQGFVSPGILAVFIFGLVNRTAGKWAGVIGLLITPVIYGIFTVYMPDLHYLHSMAFSLLISLAIMTIFGALNKLPQPVVFQTNTTMDLTSSKSALRWGIVVCVSTVILYIIFW